MAVTAVIVDQWLQQPGRTRHELPLNHQPSRVCHWLSKKKAGSAGRPDYDGRSVSGVNLRCREQLLISLVGEDAIGG